MSREDKQDWAEAYDKEYRGFMERNAFKVVRPAKGIKVHDTLTRPEYKEDNGTVSGARPKNSWVTQMVIFGPGKFYLENDDVSRCNDCFKRKETP